MKNKDMKKIRLTISVCCFAAAMLTSCADELDSDKYFDDRRSIESVFSDRNQSLGWLAQAYSFLNGPLADCKTKDTSVDGAFFRFFR